MTQTPAVRHEAQALAGDATLLGDPPGRPARFPKQLGTSDSDI